ncbi:hypothetical protein BDW75DRAFT_224829 [Aspergillus navahoensis]
MLMGAGATTTMTHDLQSIRHRDIVLKWQWIASPWILPNLPRHRSCIGERKGVSSLRPTFSGKFDSLLVLSEALRILARP